MRTPLLTLFALGAAACGPGNDAVWLFTFGEAAITARSFTCNENFLAAECPEDSDPEPGPWTFTGSATESPGAAVGPIIDAPGGQKMLVIFDEVFIGERDSGTWRFTWENFEQGDDLLAHESGYQLGTEFDLRRETVFSLDLKGGEATGRAIVQTTSSERVFESDGWLTEEVGFSFGQIGDYAPIWLDGDMTNWNDEAECSSSLCEISVTESSTVEIPLSGLRTGEDGRSFDGLSRAGQDAGF